MGFHTRLNVLAFMAFFFMILAAMSAPLGILHAAYYGDYSLWHAEFLQGYMVAP